MDISVFCYWLCEESRQWLAFSLQRLSDSQDRMSANSGHSLASNQIAGKVSGADYMPYIILNMQYLRPCAMSTQVYGAAGNPNAAAAFRIILFSPLLTVMERSAAWIHHRVFVDNAKVYRLN